ncbi:MAG: glycosyltransferase family 2 protein [Chitinophagales bacterium]|nr:glycosyltransferase family 2 protein [Chitinophagales bacterium]
METPLVSVLMSVYNGEKYLQEAMDSVLNQTYKNIEFLIINDASTDSSAGIIQSYKDDRIRFFSNEENIKLTASLNRGIDLAKGKYIARMDADDVSLPERIEKQVAFMEQHSEVGLCGTFVQNIGTNDDYVPPYKTTHDEIKFKLFFETHFPHPAAMLRKSVLDEHNLKYDTVNKVAQDYELWNKMVNYCEVTILPEPLVKKRTHSEMTSIKATQEQLQVVKNIHRELMMKLGAVPSEKELDVYENYFKGSAPKTKEELFALLDLFDKLIAGNAKAKIYRSDLFDRFFAEKYWMLCTTSSGFGMEVYRKYKQSVARNYFDMGSMARKKFFIKSFVRYKNDI